MEEWLQALDSAWDEKGLGCRLTLMTPGGVSVSCNYHRTFKENLVACIRGMTAALGEPLSNFDKESIKVESFTAT